jgi:hypothetical protein
MKTLAIYTRDNGLLNRRNENWSSTIYTQTIGIQKTNFLEYLKEQTCSFDENPEIEQLMGWPESKVEWHHNIGIGVD